VVYGLIVRPIRRIATIADEVSLGNPDAPAFPAKGAVEIVSLLRSFDRMRTSLDKAVRLLEK
jgi:protein-histidine pros-kinase